MQLITARANRKARRMESINEESDLPWKFSVDETIEILFDNQLKIYTTDQLTASAIEMILAILDWDFHIGIEH
jgi:hypothetical protein